MKQICTYFLLVCCNISNITSTTHKYLIVSLTQNEDNVYSIIEKLKVRKLDVENGDSISSPKQCVTIIQTAKYF